MEAVVFVYEENRPINYRGFAEWLFHGTPNLIVGRLDSNLFASHDHVFAAIELDLGVSRSVAENLLRNAERLGFLRNARGCYWKYIGSS